VLELLIAQSVAAFYVLMPGPNRRSPTGAHELEPEKSPARFDTVSITSSPLFASVMSNRPPRRAVHPGATQHGSPLHSERL
jgi:hypothetical protein